jgi:hypothetical protein
MFDLLPDAGYLAEIERLQRENRDLCSSLEAERALRLLDIMTIEGMQAEIDSLRMQVQAEKTAAVCDPGATLEWLGEELTR